MRQGIQGGVRRGRSWLLQLQRARPDADAEVKKGGSGILSACIRTERGGGARRGGNGLFAAMLVLPPREASSPHEGKRNPHKGRRLGPQGETTRPTRGGGSAPLRHLLAYLRRQMAYPTPRASVPYAARWRLTRKEHRIEHRNRTRKIKEWSRCPISSLSLIRGLLISPSNALVWTSECAS